MATSIIDLEIWYDRGVSQDAEYMIIVCDTFDYEDYPVYVKEGESIQDKVREYSNYDKMSKVMEVYSLKVPFKDNNAWAAANGKRLVFNYNHERPNTNTQSSRDGAVD